MKIFKFLLFSTLLMFGCRKNLEAEIVLFDKIDFNSGEYKLVFYGGEGEIIENYFNLPVVHY